MTNDRPASLGIGIAGGTGAGKTTLVRLLCDRYADVGVALLDMDSYYLDRGHLAEAERASLNYDEPGAIDHHTLVAHLERLLGGQPVDKPRYSFAEHRRSPLTDLVEPRPVILLEGLFALWEPRVRALLGLRLFVDASADLRLARRLRRDVSERGRSVESVLDQYLATVRPMHDRYVEPTRRYADIVVPGESLEAHVPSVASRIDGLLEGRAAAPATRTLHV